MGAKGFESTEKVSSAIWYFTQIYLMIKKYYNNSKMGQVYSIEWFIFTDFEI